MPGEIEHLSLQSFAMIEAELCKGQVADALEGLCLALGEKSLCFRTEVRNANSQRTTHRAWDNVHKLGAEAQKCRCGRTSEGSEAVEAVWLCLACFLR